MLITKLKSKETILDLAQGKVFAVICHGCKEVHFPVEEARELLKALNLTGSVTTDYICNPDHQKLQLSFHQEAIDQADVVLVFSCGVGVQTVADILGSKKVLAACDTYPLPGFQGVTPLNVACNQCGECYLNITGGICPITACSKSLLNGQCGGAKDGKCEVDPNMDCGWERIYQKLKALGREDLLKCPIQIRNYATDDEV